MSTTTDISEPKIIHAKNGGEILVDAEDYERLSAHSWRLDKDGYAVRAKSTIKMHRELMGLVKGDGKQADHANGNKADNRKINLRVCTNIQNHWNVKRQINNTTGYKGVEWLGNRSKWRARVSVGKKRVFLGHFETLEEARSAYETYVSQAHGEFANFGA